MNDDIEGTAGHGRMSLKKIRDEVKFYPHQLSGVRTLAKKKSFLLADEMGGGKAQPIGALVATPTGWVPIGLLKVGDKICKPSGGTQRILQLHPQGRIAVAKVKFADGAETICSWDHLWTVSDGSDWQTLTTREISESELSQDDGLPRWEIPLLRPLKTSGKSLPDGIDPFTLGFVAAGGIAFESRTELPNQLKVSNGRYEVAKMLKIPNTVLKFGSECFIQSDQSHPQAIRDFMKQILSLGISVPTKKRVFPDAIRFAPQSERMRFFLGLLAGGSSVEWSSQHRFGISFTRYNTIQFCRGVVELIQLLGGLAVLDTASRRITVWWPTPIRLWNGTTISTPRPVRSIVGVGPAGFSECTCITVDDPEGLYVTSGGVVTHNSLQALTVAAIDYEIGNASKSLIVCPATLKDNWHSEIQQFTNYKSIVCNGTKAKRIKQIDEFRNQDIDFLIMNYEQVASHLDDINGCNLDVLIFDEAHYLKGPTSKRTKSCHKIASRRSFMLTGSPMLNQPQELWGILHRINPTEFPSFWKFSQRYCVFGGYQAKQIIGVKNRSELLEILDRYMLRRLKTEMIKLPDKNFIKVQVPLSALQASLYKEAETELRLVVPDEPEPLELENALTKILRLKQITGTPATLGFEDQSIKLDRCIQIVEQLAKDNEKVVVFTQFRGVLSAIEERLKKLSIPVWTLSGSVPNDKRVPLVHSWRDSSDSGVLLSMLQVGGVGLDFTAASNVIFVDKLYVPAMNDQAVDRLHRLSMNKTKQVNIYELIASGTVEDRVEKILERKRKMTKEIIDNAGFRKLVIAALHEKEL